MIEAANELANGQVIGLLVAALAFGVAYNQITAWLDATGRADGYTSLLVVGGVLGTLVLASFVIGLQPALWVLLFFALSGLPMMLGDIWRHTDERQRQMQRVQQVLDEQRHTEQHFAALQDELRQLRRKLDAVEDEDGQ